MEDLIFKNVLSKEGIFAIMFVFLLIYVLRDSKQREERLMKFIDDISKQYEKLADSHERLSQDVHFIKERLK